MKSQSYAVHIEHILERIFNCDRYGLGGLINSDKIRKLPIYSMMCGLTHIYNNHNKVKIDKFFEDFSFYADWSIDTLLGFDTCKKIINGGEYEINYKNGELAIEDIIRRFDEIVDN